MRSAIALWKVALIVATALVARISCAATIELVMPPTPISATGDRAVFSTPMDYSNGHLAVAQVENPDAQTPSGYLRTVLHHGTKDANNVWKWDSTVINRMTLHDPYHTQPSLAFDRDGYLHVAFNMHHVPWQYVISSRPYQATAFLFRGDPITKDQLDTIRLYNRTFFPNAGKALIPGNQITYPAFVKDRVGNLYAVYRYATRPAREWDERAYAIGIARYDTSTRKWQPIGMPRKLNPGDAVDESSGNDTTHPFIYDERRLPYLVTIAFDHRNDMHAIWTWWDKKRGLDGSNTFMPSYRNVGGLNTAIPEISFAEAERIPGWTDDTIFNTAKALDVAANGDLLAILEVKGKARYLIRRFHETGKWGIPLETPNSAAKIKVSNDGTEWLFASGLTVFKRSPGGAWAKAAQIGTDLCDPWPVYIAQENKFFIRAKNCADFSNAAIYSYKPD